MNRRLSTIEESLRKTNSTWYFHKQEDIKDGIKFHENGGVVSYKLGLGQKSIIK